MAESEGTENEETETTEEGSSKPPASGSTGDAGGDSDMRKEIRRIIREEMRTVIGRGSSASTSKGRDVEAEARAAVEAEAAKLVAEKEHAAEHETIKKIVKAPPATESTPVKLRRLTKFMWGEK